MARQANIFSFDDARAATRSRRARENAPAADSRRTLRSSRTSASADSSRSTRSASAYGYGDDQPLRMPSGRSSRAARSVREVDSRYYEDEIREQDPLAEDDAAVKVESKRERRRRERAKARADKMFTEQFEGVAASPDEAEGAPRAALYEGKMGSSHRRSARMQRASSAAPQSAKLNPAGWFSNLNVSPRVLKIGTAVLCLVLAGVFLYTPAQQYYQAQRERDKLAAEYALLEERNEALGSQNTALSSNAGMEDAVREKYGYVVKGDETAVVTGLSETTTDSSRDPDNIEANVLSSSIKAPEEWYTPYLDAFFGVS